MMNEVKRKMTIPEICPICNRELNCEHFATNKDLTWIKIEESRLMQLKTLLLLDIEREKIRTDLLTEEIWALLNEVQLFRSLENSFNQLIEKFKSVRSCNLNTCGECESEFIGISKIISDIQQKFTGKQNEEIS